jgi:hypothetical protein
MVDRLFDLLNSRNVNDTGLKAPLSKENLAETEAFVANVKKELLYKRNAHLKSIYETRKGTSILGLICCAKSFVGLGKTLLNDDKVPYLLGYKFSQDHLELFFNAIRGARKLTDKLPGRKKMNCRKILIFTIK